MRYIVENVLRGLVIFHVDYCMIMQFFKLFKAWKCTAWVSLKCLHLIIEWFCLKNIPQRRWEWCRLTICVSDQIVKSLKLANVSNCLSTSSATTNLLSYKNSLTASILEQISVIKSWLNLILMSLNLQYPPLSGVLRTVVSVLLQPVLNWLIPLTSGFVLALEWVKLALAFSLLA